MRRRLPSALQERSFALFFVTLVGSGLAQQMVAVAIGWQVYGLHHDPFDLALIGLAEFVPTLVLALPGGQLADRAPRTIVVAVSTAANGLVTALLLVVTLEGARQLWPFLALATASGAAAAMGSPAGRALVTELVPPEELPSALALRSVGYQIAGVGGPALGGLLFGLQREAVYVTGTVLFAVALAAVAAMPRSAVASALADDPAPGLRSVLLGIRFIRDARIILGAITLDLFAVLFGGAVALLPLFAKSILHTGPLGLGVLRSATAIGALVGGIQLARKPLERHAGRTLLLVVGAFGVCMIVFGLSKSLPLSFAALAVSGYVDMFSMNIRSTVVALATPNALRGRVNAVEGVFIGASNELGAFESGAAAALLGAVPAVVIGGAITLALAVFWPLLFPALSTVDRMHEVTPVTLD